VRVTTVPVVLHARSAVRGAGVPAGVAQRHRGDRQPDLLRHRGGRDHAAAVVLHGGQLPGRATAGAGRVRSAEAVSAPRAHRCGDVRRGGARGVEVRRVRHRTVRRARPVARRGLTGRAPRVAEIVAALPRFALGQRRKALVAVWLATLATACFRTPAEAMTFAIALLDAITYTLQLFFDLSGYSDMAIGLGRMLGFRLPENFARPYASVTVTEFWRRWHMSLSRWFRDYVYIPLGGNRAGPRKTYRNLCIVFVLTGFWHGAAWTYLLWGIWHGALLIIERSFGLAEAPAKPVARALRRMLTIVLVIFGWVLFNSADLGSALTMIGHMLLPDFTGLTDVVEEAFTNQRLVILLAAASIFFLPAHPVTGPLLESSRSTPAGVLRVGVMTCGLIYAAILVATGTFSPFLYYQF